MQKLSDRTATFTDSLIRRMTRVSMQYDAINLSQGFPDFNPPKAITDRLAEISGIGPHQYAVTWGAPNFRAALAAKQTRYMGMPIDPDTQVLVTCGSTEAMMCAMMTVCNPGDKVIIFSPFYENYGADTILTGAVPIYVQLEAPNFTFDPEKLEDAFRQHPKAIVVCNPSNPTGRVFTLEELTIIADLAKKYDTYVITDEVYEHIIYEPYHHTYMASLPGMFERTISCSSLSKTYSMTGWRLGYIIAPEEIIDTAKKVHDFLTVGASAPLMEAAVVGLNLGDDYYRDLLALYTDRRSLFLNGLDRLDIRHNTPEGAYYVMLDISEFKGYDTDVDFCVKLAEKVGVGAVPGSAFYDIPEHRYIRMHFAKSEETLNEALNRLERMKKVM
ncbi:MAG: pyridoxal phosphate-dependent aminotransferase [Oscillospiraceae bacterium]|nr:pyridoxal phosphate-dependent aminotransferase [Oscillospiraceae bacterium]